MSEPVLLYGHALCPGLPPVEGTLKQTGVPYTYINIHEDEEARERVKSINNGFESVPTLVFPDGSTLTEPSFEALRRKLVSLGYRVGIVAWFIGNAWRIITASIVIFGILRFLEII